ncbi:MAG TPA: 23S rRNA (guanosine(2251)-2'-O)-methyltransferase RlmB [Solirubrobacteraceae bacterium]|nr:23S rRNA (guanosine(2251)-2'-O)-methyltransferase RlmB [Solirubrobacteraceae bacterium]
MQAGRVIIYGRNPVREAIRGPRKVLKVWATKNAAREEWLQRARPILATGEEIEARSGSPSHQGVCAEVSEFRYASADELLGAPEPFIVALDQVQDPQNLGSISRTAECGGATGLVVPERRAAEVTAAVCKASAGAVEHLPIARVRNLADFLGEAKAAGCWCYGADGAGKTSYAGVDYGGGVVLVLGSEGQGLRPRVAAACDALVALPIRGRIESLGVSSAAAVLVYEVARGRNPPAGA